MAAQRPRGWLVVLGLLAGCAAPAEPGFPGGAPFDYQLGGAYPPPAGVELVVRDSTAEPAAGLYNVCYVNAFQTQPADRARWLTEHPDLVLRDPAGEPLTDENWPDELILDTRRADAVADLLAPTIETCGDRGFDAVELDNLDSYLRSAGVLTLDDNLALARELVDRAHDAGLTAGQKNTAELGGRGRAEAGFDFAITEECARHDECPAYQEAYGDNTLNIEYTDDWPDPADACATATTPTVVRDRDLVPPDEAGHYYRRC